MDLQPKLLPHSSNGNYPRDPQLSMIHDCESNLHQLKESVLAQPIGIPSASVNLKSEGSKTISRKVKDIDRRLKEGWFFAYELWLYFIIVLALSKGVFMCGWMYEMWDMTRNRDRDQSWFIAFLILLIFALYYIYWTVRQALLHKEALRKKDEKIAAKAYDSVVRLSIHYFILCVIFLCVGRYFEYYYFKLTDSWKEFLFNIGYPTFQFISHYAIPVPISIYGSYKIKILLEERKNLIGETEIIRQPQPYLPLDPSGKKLEELDQRLDRGWLFLAYKIWLYLTPILGIYLFRRRYELEEVSYQEYRSGIFYWGLLGYAFHCFFLFVRQAWFEIIAMKQKDAKIATKAYDSLVWFAKYDLIWVFINLLDFAYSLWILSTEGDMRYAVRLLIFLFIRLIKFYLIPMGISVYGSKQVMNLLKEKQALIPDDDVNDDASYCEPKI